MAPRVCTLNLLNPPRHWYPYAPSIARWLCWTISRAICIAFGVKIENMEKLPAKGPLLAMAPHANYLDPIFLFGAMPRPALFLADSFFIFLNPITAWLTWMAAAIPVNRKQSDPYSLRQFLRELARGELCAFFPEGARTLDGRILAPMMQAAKLAAKVQTPVALFSMNGTYDLWPRWDPRPRFLRRRVTVRFERLLKDHPEKPEPHWWK